MNKTLVGLVLIALLIGLGGGYVLGYAIYQPQLQNLQNDLNNMGDDLDNLSNDLDNTQSSVTALNTRVATLNSSLTSAELSLTTLQDQLNGLQNQLTTLQNQLTSLNSKLSSLNSTVERIENRSWHMVQAISGSTDTTTGTFQLRGKEIRVMWTAEGVSSSSWLSIGLRFSNGTLYSYYGSSGIWAAINVDEELEQSGQYYLTVFTFETDYVIAIWDYY